MGSLEVVGREDIERQQQERQGVSAHDGGRHGENFRRGRHENADHAEHRPEDVEERRRPQCQPERLADAVAPASAEVCGDDGLRRLPDARPLWGLLGRETEAGREEYARELEATVKALQCHPCVGCWVPFNEGWGQFDAAGAVEAVRRLDDTRLVDEASGWYDQGGGDVDSLHNYFYPLRVRPRSRVVALSEYGGIAWPMPGHEPPRRAYGYGTAKSRAELTARWKKLQLETVLPQLKKGLSALVYTQVSDVEDEVNGLFTYDRAAIKPDPAAVRAVNQALEAAFEKTVE